MSTYPALYDAFATIVTYPVDGYVAQARNCRQRVFAINALGDATSAPYGVAGGHLDSFLATVGDRSIGELEELYTRTFDVNPISSLELGWHLFGETYERGSFLVKMRTVLRQLEIAETTELPDHLSSALAAFGRMDEPEALAYARDCLLPALRKMLDGFTDKSNPYEHVLRAVQTVVAARTAPLEGTPRHV